MFSGWGPSKRGKTEAKKNSLCGFQEKRRWSTNVEYDSLNGRKTMRKSVVVARDDRRAPRLNRLRDCQLLRPYVASHLLSTARATGLKSLRRPCSRAVRRSAYRLQMMRARNKELILVMMIPLIKETEDDAEPEPTKVVKRERRP